MQQQDDAPPQEQSDSTGTQARVNALTDVKAKPAELNREDNGTATPAHDRAADTIAEPAATSFPDQYTFIRKCAGNDHARIRGSVPRHGGGDSHVGTESSRGSSPTCRSGAGNLHSDRAARRFDDRFARGGAVLGKCTSMFALPIPGCRRRCARIWARSPVHWSGRAITARHLRRPRVWRAHRSSGQVSNQDDHQDSSQNRNGSGDFSGGRRQQQQQKRPSTWLEELEDQP